MTENTPSQKQTVAVIDIGSSAIRMVIAELGPKTEIRKLENLQKPVAFGKDVFKTGKISRAVMREGLTIMKNFKSIIDSYGITNVHAVTTSAVRDALNRESFVDQVFVRTGIDVEVIEGPEENRLELLAVEHALGDKHEYQAKNCLIIEVGSGSIEIIVLNKGEVGLTRTISLGTVRLPEQLVPGKTSPEIFKRTIKRTIGDVIQHFSREYNLKDIDTFIALGGDMRFLAKQQAGADADAFAVLPKKNFTDFLNGIAKIPLEELSEKFGMVYSEAETLFPALLFYANFLEETSAKEIVIPMTNIRDGLLIELSQLFSGYKRTDVSKQVISSARQLGKRYRYDEPHSLLVSSLALKLFDLLKQDHGLGTRERLLLEVSGVLHDIGMFIASTSYHKHSSYLVEAAEIFGLRKQDKNIVSNVVRYHRRALPQQSHEPYMSLPRADRVVVSKLAAILRVADALDKARQQKIKNFSLEKQDEVYTIWVPEEVGDISFERDSVAKRSTLFAEVFGVPLDLKQGTAPKA